MTIARTRPADDERLTLAALAAPVTTRYDDRGVPTIHAESLTDLAFAQGWVHARGAGFHPVNIDVSDPEWKEAFLMPREANGTVVQLAESHGHPESRAEMIAHVGQNGPNSHPRWWVCATVLG